jgi:hypothetical protein
MASSADKPTVVSPLPDHRHLYLLVAGVLIGILLSPAVAGRVLPQGWQTWFFGGAEIEQRLEQIRDEAGQQIERLDEADANRETVQERVAENNHRIADARRRLVAHRDRTAARYLLSLTLALGVVMVLEAVLAPPLQPGNQSRAAVSPAFGRLITVRYALLAVWVALLLMRPSLLGLGTLGFAAAVLAVALLLGLVPLRFRRGADEGE